jgi:hypothetical protein
VALRRDNRDRFHNALTSHSADRSRSTWYIDGHVELLSEGQLLGDNLQRRFM